MKDKEYVINEVKAITIKLEGMINLLKETPQVAAFRKAQSARDKSSHLLNKLVFEDDSSAEKLVSELAGFVKYGDSNEGD